MGKILSIIFIVVVLGTIGALVYVIATHNFEQSTEFYILGLDGKATGYPKQLEVGEVGRVIVGIVNKEQTVVSYRVEIQIDGMINNEFGPITIEPNNKREEIVHFNPDTPGVKQKVEFLLYKESLKQPYLKLHLLVDVGVLDYVMTAPAETPGVQIYSEFYILRLGGEAAGNPKELKIGKERGVIVGIVNKEQAVVSYQLLIGVVGIREGPVCTIKLEPNDKWEERVYFSLERAEDKQVLVAIINGERINFFLETPGVKQEVEFILYKDNQRYLKVHLWVNVKG